MRSGATVYLAAPNVELLGPQPPLSQSKLIDALLDVGNKIIPSRHFHIEPPRVKLDLVILLGDTTWTGEADLVVSINASDWSCQLSEAGAAAAWAGNEWPFGALGAAALAAGEAFKVAMRKLRDWRKHDIFDDFFALTTYARLQLASDLTQKRTALDRADFVSGGAIANAAIFALARLPAARGVVRVIEPDLNGLSNANRYPLLTLDRLNLGKAHDLATRNLGNLKVRGLPLRFDATSHRRIGTFAPSVLVGVDHIPSRWDVQRTLPKWLGIGATSHYGVMITVHEAGLPCATCAHPIDDPGTDLIPTVNFISFWAGLLLAVRYVRHMSGIREDPAEQLILFHPLRPERPPQRGPVPFRPGCVWTEDRAVASR
jgi:hypothetical protein